MSEEKLKNIMGLTRRDIGEVEAYFEGIRQGVALACGNIASAMTLKERQEQLMKIVDSHHEVWRMGVEG